MCRLGPTWMTDRCSLLDLFVMASHPSRSESMCVCSILLSTLEKFSSSACVRKFVAHTATSAERPPPCARTCSASQEM
eukprot:COSAG01_NODE_182_length_22838_cov_34.788733_13_plen_78_part_00